MSSEQFYNMTTVAPKVSRSKPSSPNRHNVTDAVAPTSTVPRRTLANAAAWSANAVTWPLGIQLAGDYEVQARWTAHPNRASDAKYSIGTSTGDTTVTVNQQANGGAWQSLGTYNLDANRLGRIGDFGNE